MKRTAQLLSITFILLSIFSSCSIEKRKYLSGYSFQWNHFKTVIPKNDPSTSVKHLEDNNASVIRDDDQGNDAQAYAASDNSTIIYHKSKILKLHPNAVPEDCDVITLKNGNEIKAKV